MVCGQKVEQAIAILAELEIDAWLTFVRETGESGDPVLPLILGQSLTWQSALILTRSGDRIAIVGKYDDGAVRKGGIWTEVMPYVQTIRDPLVSTLRRLDPQSVALNFSRDDVKADGLTHGMFLLLEDYLAETPYGSRIRSAAELIDALRGRKSSDELARIRRAIATTDEIFAAVSRHVRIGMTELEVSRFLQGEAAKRSVGLAWDPHHCPIVTTGPDSMVGHGFPSDTLTVTPGGIFHLDFGVRENDYCSDIQRSWYVPASGESAPPPDVTEAFATVRQAIDAGARALRPGVEGWRVDAAARAVVTSAGHPEYPHATGHHVGRSAHDGGGVLGPRWERYGNTPYRKAQPGHVYTLELGLEVEGRGYLGLEEMVLVTEGGCEYLTTPPRKLPLLGAGRAGS